MPVGEKEKMNKYAYIIGILLLAAFAVMGATEMMKSQTPYITTVAEVKSLGGRPVQFIGTIIHAKTDYDEKSDELHFQLMDDNRKALNVSYKGVKPGNFDSANKAVVRGKYRGGRFFADQLLLKCPSKYESR